jgi:hypothetical protein
MTTPPAAWLGMGNTTADAEPVVGSQVVPTLTPHDPTRSPDPEIVRVNAPVFDLAYGWSTPLTVGGAKYCMLPPHALEHAFVTHTW